MKAELSSQYSVYVLRVQAEQKGCTTKFFSLCLGVCVVKMILTCGLLPAAAGSFDSVRLSPHFAQDDNLSFFSLCHYFAVVKKLVNSGN